MAGIASGVVSILDWLKDKLPIQDRKERWKNEIDGLEKERNRLLLGECDDKKVARLGVIDKRIAYLNQLFKNQTAK